MRDLHRITTRRLIIQECYDVVREHVEWLNDKALMRWSEQRYREHDERSQDGFLTHAYACDNPLVFDIRRLDGPAVPGDDTRRMLSLSAMNTGGTIGSLHAHLDRQHKRADIGIMLGPQYHRHGYAVEAWSAVEKLLADKERIAKFEGGSVDRNLAMTNLFNRLGYRHEGTRERHFLINGKTHDLFLWGKEIHEDSVPVGHGNIHDRGRHEPSAVSG